MMRDIRMDTTSEIRRRSPALRGRLARALGVVLLLGAALLAARPASGGDSRAARAADSAATDSLGTNLLTPEARFADPRNIEVNLRLVKARHYNIHTDLDTALAQDLARRMDAMYEEYARRLADFRPDQDPPPLEAYLFRRQRDYLTFTMQRLKNTGGVYIPRRNTLAAFLEGQGRDTLRRTLQHEAFHQFAYNFISENLPIWLNEGMAQVFEEGIWTGDEFLLGQVPPRRLRQLEADIKSERVVDFPTLMRMSTEKWAENLEADHDLGATQYNQSWAMVYFLINARDAGGRELYRARLLDMLRMLHEGREPDVAFKEAFSDNIKGFHDRFIEFVATLHSTDEATLIERQGVLADLLAQLKGRGKAYGTMSGFRQGVVRGKYRLHYSKGQLEWDTEPDLRVYFSDLGSRPFGPDELFFEPRASAPLPDIVCKVSPRMQLRTRFHAEVGDGEKIEHELLIERPGRGAAARASAEHATRP